MKKSKKFRLAWIRNKQKKEGDDFLKKIKKCSHHDEKNWRLLDPNKCLKSEKIIKTIQQKTPPKNITEIKDISPEKLDHYYISMCERFEHYPTDQFILSTLKHFPQLQIVIKKNSLKKIKPRCVLNIDGDSFQIYDPAFKHRLFIDMYQDTFNSLTRFEIVAYENPQPSS